MVFLEFVPFPGITEGMSEFPPVSPERGMCQSKGLEVEQGLEGWKGTALLCVALPRGARSCGFSTLG